MVIFARNLRLAEGELPGGDEQAVIFLPAETLRRDAKTLGLDALAEVGMQTKGMSRFESHAEYDCLLLMIPDRASEDEMPAVTINLYYTEKRLLIVHTGTDAVQRVMKRLDPDGDDTVLAYDQVLPGLLDSLTQEDTENLMALENRIVALEEGVSSGDGIDPLPEISALRRILMINKRYFESLVAALEDQEEGQMRFLSKSTARSMRVIVSRVERQMRTVLNLRDYVTQVREAYQSQMDISLNRTMKLFTVITAIFSPLTLLVGWYGMNLRMPELDWPYLYPVVLGVTALVVAGSIYFFKRKRWF